MLINKLGISYLPYGQFSQWWTGKAVSHMPYGHDYPLTENEAAICMPSYGQRFKLHEIIVSLPFTWVELLCNWNNKYPVAVLVESVHEWLRTSSLYTQPMGGIIPVPKNEPSHLLVLYAGLVWDIKWTSSSHTQPTGVIVSELKTTWQLAYPSSGQLGQ